MDRTRRSRLLKFIAGWVCIALGAGQIAHFTVNAALAGFPDMMLKAMWNWIFVAIHAALCATGLFLLGWAKRKMEDKPERGAGEPAASNGPASTF